MSFQSQKSPTFSSNIHIPKAVHRISKFYPVTNHQCSCWNLWSTKKPLKSAFSYESFNASSDIETWLQLHFLPKLPLWRDFRIFHAPLAALYIHFHLGHIYEPFQLIFPHSITFHHETSCYFSSTKLSYIISGGAHPRHKSCRRDTLASSTRLKLSPRQAITLNESWRGKQVRNNRVSRRLSDKVSFWFG